MCCADQGGILGDVGISRFMGSWRGAMARRLRMGRWCRGRSSCLGEWRGWRWGWETRGVRGMCGRLKGSDDN